MALKSCLVALRITPVLGGWGWRTETESPTRRRPRVRDGVKLFLDSFSPTHRLTSVPPSRRSAEQQMC